MKSILKFIILSLLLLPLRVYAQSFTFPDETLHYVITYKWGLISKETGDATLSLRNHGDKYSLTMSAKTRPWADKIFTVRDTLYSTVAKNGLKPIKYTKITHEGDHHGKDVVNFSHYGSTVGGSTHKENYKKEGTTTKDAKLTASGPTYDMLSVFYYLRTIDLAKLAANKNMVSKVTIFSGSKAETMKIRCVGVETITLLNKTKRKAYHVKFRFTTKGGKKSSDDMDAWLSYEAPHIPLHLSGSLPIGAVKVYLK